MRPNIDIVDLADEIAEIASTTTDPETGRLLLDLVRRLLEASGMPPDPDGGGETPTDAVHAVADSPEFA